MKRFALTAVVALMMLPTWAAQTQPETKLANQAATVVLNRAVREGFVTEQEKTAFLKSGILEEATRTLLATHFDVAATVDKAAEQAVRKGYFKSKTQAKRYLRQSIEQARKAPGFWQKLYQALGI